MLSEYGSVTVFINDLTGVFELPIFIVNLVHLTAMLHVWLCLCLLVLRATHSNEAPVIKPSQLLIGTVIDTTNSEIVRDAINFLKSIRMFGKSMNEASILIGITGSYEECIVDRTLLPLLADVGVEVVFIAQTVKYAKTLNKFKMFDLFDSTKYDYFLWLDADIIVFDDPVPYLHMHRQPGEIECVPDFYSYMRRFPTVNTSEEYWNPSLATIRLLGEYEMAPNGLCNTGLLYFDSLSLSNFREGLHNIMNNVTFLEKHGNDRFVDSLIFTKVVHDRTLDVSVLPNKLNYMALFEIEIQEEAPVQEIVMAHLVSDTELYCITSPSADPSEKDQCSCVYRNKLLPPNGSVLKDTIQAKLLSSRDICLKFAGVDMPALPPGVPHLPANKLLQNSTFTNMHTSSDHTVLHGCELLTPPGADWVLFVAQMHDPAALLIDVSIVCSVSHKMFDEVQSLPQMAVSNDIFHSLGRVVHHSVLKVSPAAASSLECTGDVCTIHINYTIELVIPTEITQTLNPAVPHANFSLKIGVELLETPQTLHEKTSDFSVVFENLLTPGQVHYSTNLLLSTKSIALESQLLLPQFLNARYVRGTGVMACCDTHKGVTTVQLLINQWRGDHLLIIVQRVPLDPRRDNLESRGALQLLAEDFRHLCNRRMETDRANNKFMCHITMPPAAAETFEEDHSVSYTRRLVTALRANSAQFVFSDVMFPFAEKRALLTEYSRVLAKGGILVGTQYSSAHRMCFPDFEWNTPASNIEASACTRTILKNNGQQQITVESSRGYDVDRGQSRRALDSLQWKLSQSALLTYGERELHFCDVFVQRRRRVTGIPDSGPSAEEAVEVECAPAWYLFKQRNIW